MNWKMSHKIAKNVKGIIVLLGAAGFNIAEMYNSAELSVDTTGGLIAIGGGIAAAVYFWEARRKTTQSMD